jgi:hypothetical protein
MRKRYALLMAAGVLAVGMLSLGLAVRPYLDPATGHYPGSQVMGEQKLAYYSPDSQSLVRQSTYQTADALPMVRAWYVQHLRVLATENVTAPGGNCVWLGRSRQATIVQYSASALLCTVAGGTRINLDESVALAR